MTGWVGRDACVMPGLAAVACADCGVRLTSILRTLGGVGACQNSVHGHVVSAISHLQGWKNGTTLMSQVCFDTNWLALCAQAARRSIALFCEPGWCEFPLSANAGPACKPGRLLYSRTHVPCAPATQSGGARQRDPRGAPVHLRHVGLGSGPVDGVKGVGGQVCAVEVDGDHQVVALDGVQGGRGRRRRGRAGRRRGDAGQQEADGICGREWGGRGIAVSCANR